MKTIKVSAASRSYPVYIGTGIRQQGEIWAHKIRGSQVLVVSNETVAPLYLDEVLDAVSASLVDSLILADGERYKTAREWLQIVDKLVALKASRDVTVLALGGGVIGDLAGFAAATYMRGVGLIQFPTSLLAQVDAAVGGKTAINHSQGKNLIGAFYQPDAVVIDTSTLVTLPEREYIAGLAEVVKYGALGDAEFFIWLQENAARLKEREPEAVQHAIERSVQSKAAIVAADETESGQRALLNLGHTFAHAIETAGAYSEWLHGEAVAVGMLLAARLSEIRGIASPNSLPALTGLLAELDLPVRLPAGVDKNQLLDIMRLDKKNLSGQFRFVLLSAIGQACIDQQVDEAMILQTLDESSNQPS